MSCERIVFSLSIDQLIFYIEHKTLYKYNLYRYKIYIVTYNSIKILNRIIYSSKMYETVFKLILEVQLGAPLIGILSPCSLFKFHDATFDRS